MVYMQTMKIRKVLTALLLVGFTHIAMAAFTGNSEKKVSDLYTLKNFNKSFFRNASPFSLRSGFEYKGLRFLNEKKDINGDITINSMMRFEKGNVTYIYPYTHKIVVPRFKTPTTPQVMR